MKRHLLLIALFFISILSMLNAETEQPPYEVTDPAISENFRNIYQAVDQHKHNEDGSSRLENVIPSSGAAFDIGTSSNFFVNSYANQYWMIASTRTPNRQDAAVIYSSGTSAEVFVMDEAGNATQISPHNKEGRWIFNSYNVQTGKHLRVDMERLAELVEKLSGEKLIYERR